MRDLVHPDAPLMPHPRGRRFDLLAGGGVLLAALVLRLYYLQLLRRTPLFDQIMLDPAYYVEWGRRIAAGDWLGGSQVFEQSPLYAYILAFIFKIAGYGLLVPRIVQAVVGAGTCWLVFRIARRAFGRPAALAAGLLAAVYGPGLFYDGMVMKTTWAVFLTAAMTAALLDSGGSRRGLLLAAGVLLGLASLVRDNLILLAPLLVVWLAADVWVRRSLDSGLAKEAAVRIVCFAAGVSAVVLPVTARNVAVSGEWVLLTSGGGEVFYIGNNPNADGKYSPPPFVRAASVVEHEDFRLEAARRLGRPVTRRESSIYWLREGLRWIVSNPLDYVSLLARKAVIFLNGYELPDNQNFDHHRSFVPLLRFMPAWPLLLPLAAAGLALSLHRWRDLLPLCVIGGGYAATVMLFFNFARFRMPLVPLLLVFAGEAVVEAAAALRPGSPRGRALAAAGTAAAAALLALLPIHNDPLHRGQAESQFADLLLRAGRVDEARAASQRAVDLAESVYLAAGGRPADGGRGVAPAGDPGRPALGASYYGVLMDTYRVRALVERAGGDAREAPAWLRRAVEASPDDEVGFGVLIAYGEALLGAGRPSEALPPLERARSVNARHFRLALLYAQALHRAGRPLDAITVVDDALAANPVLDPLDLADANFGLGLVYRDLGDLPRMRFHLREALGKNPRHPRAEWIRRVLAGAEGGPGP